MIGSGDLHGGGGAQDARIRTFLIADVRGYTLFTQERGDEAAAKLAGKFADIVREVVETRGGRLLELRGDEALCIFDSTRDAIRTAIDLQVRFVEETMAQPELPLTVGIGLDAGEAVAVEGGYRGGALNLAARLCGQARAGEILASREVTHLARRLDGVRYEDRGALTFKGIQDAVTVVRVVPETEDPAERLRPFAPPAPPPPRPTRRWIVPAAVALALAVVAVAIPMLGGDDASVRIGSDSVALIDLEDGSVALSETIGDRPGAMAVAFDSVWVVQPDRGLLVRLGLDGSVQDTIPVGSAPAAIAAGDDEMWVTNAADGTVSRVDVETNQESVTLLAGSRPTGIASGGGALWVADTTGASPPRTTTRNRCRSRSRVSPRGSRGPTTAYGSRTPRTASPASIRRPARSRTTRPLGTSRRRSCPPTGRSGSRTTSTGRFRASSLRPATWWT
jgi:class 3 adenylate cyclase